MKNWPESVDNDDPKTPRLELPQDPSAAIYEGELRNRMYMQLIGAVLGLVVPHLIQVKFKIHRGYFWFVVGGVIVAMVLNSYRPKYDPNRSSPTSDSAPEYAPLKAR